jgi:nicotinate-nucleotide pyrophosphorylase (carboxylating)
MADDGILTPLYSAVYEDVIRRAFAEDLGVAGDITTDAIVPPATAASGVIVARSAGRLAGLQVAASAFMYLEPVAFESRVPDGYDVDAGAVLASVRGPARAILTSERIALNLLSRLSGIATATREIVRAVAPFGTGVACTRKTTPGLRALEKYAVRAGGGANHRFGLDDAVLIKDNHRAVAGSIEEAVRRVQRRVGHMVKIEVEVDTLEQLDAALALKIDAVLLDNMSLDTLAEGVRRAKGKALTEASGGITAANAALFAGTGVDLLSIGWITHSPPALDVSLEL